MLMVTKCTLWPYLADIDCQANEMYDLLIEQMKVAEGVTENLKSKTNLNGYRGWAIFSNGQMKLYVAS